MKKLLSILSFLILSCSSDKYDFENIEIMSYYYHYDNNSKIILDRIFYTYINKNGTSHTIRKTEPSGKETYYESKINPEHINRIISETKDKDENYFKQPKDSLFIRLYCGPIIRFKITDKNARTLTFTFEENNNIKKLSPYYDLYKSLINDSLNIRPQDHSIIIYQKEFEQFVSQKDTSELAIPPPPKIMKIKFIKPKK